MAPDFIATALLGAASAASRPPDGWSAPPVSPLASLGQLALSLVVVVALIFAMAWLYRRARGIAPNARSPLRVVAQLALGHKERLIVVDVNGKQLLLGVSPGRVNKLHELEQPVAPPDVPDPARRFSDMLSAVRARRGDR